MELQRRDEEDEDEDLMAKKKDRDRERERESCREGERVWRRNKEQFEAFLFEPLFNGSLPIDQYTLPFIILLFSPHFFFFCYNNK